MKLVNAQYHLWSDDDGISYATVKHLNKLFTGLAHLHPKDKDRESQFAGCDIAEQRAQIKALKYELKLKKEKCDECRNFVKACECYKNWDKESPSAKVVYRQLNRRIKEVNDLIDTINRKMDNLDRFIKRRDTVLGAIERKKLSKNN